MYVLNMLILPLTLAEVLKTLLVNIAGSLHKISILALAKIELALIFCLNLIRKPVNNI